MQLNPSDPRFIIALVVIALIVVIAVAVYISKRRKTSANLRQRFGSEYDRAVLEHGSESKAEARLAAREERVEHLHIRDLTPTERERYLADWQTVQSRFVDHPKGAVIEADELVASLMNARGYPVSDFEQRAADVSVNHPRVVEYYRSAHDVALRLARDEATTEDMRTAMIQYRTLFDELLQIPVNREVANVA
jgi:hypothetical protein